MTSLTTLKFLRSAVCLSVLLVAVLAGPRTMAQTETAAPLAVIVHESSPVNALSVNELRRVLMGETTEWPDRKRVVLVERDAASRVFRTVLRIVCRMTPIEYKRHLLSIEFQGGQAPIQKVLNSDDAATKFVRSVPGAIGVVESSSLAAVQHVKVLKIGGKLPGEAGYLLQ